VDLPTPPFVIAIAMTWGAVCGCGARIHNGELLEFWTGTGWQRVRYESAGRANAFLVMKDDTTQTLDRARR
jgi:hypothetical protein